MSTPTLQTLFDKKNVKVDDIPDLPSPGQPGKGGKKRLSVERIYQKKTQLEHILLRPDTYIGSTEPVTQVRITFFSVLTSCSPGLLLASETTLV